MCIFAMIQFAIQVDAYIAGIPSVFYVVSAVAILLRLSRLDGVNNVLSHILPIGYISVLLVLLNYFLGYSDFLSTVSFLKSSAHFLISITAFSIVAVYFHYLKSKYQLQPILKVCVIVLAVLLVGSLAEIFFARSFFEGVRLVLYGKDSSSLEYLQRTEAIAGFYRPMLFASEPSFLARQILFNIVVICICLRGTKLGTATTLTLLFLFLACGAITGSPIGITAAIAGSVVVALGNSGGSIPLKTFIASLVLSAVLVGGTLATNLGNSVPIISRFEKIAAGRDPSAEARTAGLSIAYDVVSASPWFGVGFGQIDRVYDLSNNSILRDSAFYGEAKDVMTNIFAGLLIIMGVPGILLFLFVHGRIVWGKYRRIPAFYLPLVILFGSIQGAAIACTFWVPLGVVFGLVVVNIGRLSVPVCDEDCSYL